MIKVILPLLFLSACEQPPYELYIDSACTPEHQQLIRDGIANINAWVGHYADSTPIEYTGTKKYNHEKALDKTGSYSELDTIVCLYEKPPLYPEGYWLGWSEVSGGDSYLFLFQDEMTDPKIVRSVIAHELGHYIGLGHSDDEHAVMWPYPIGQSEYTDADTALLCAERECPTFSVCD